MSRAVKKPVKSAKNRAPKGKAKAAKAPVKVQAKVSAKAKATAKPQPKKGAQTQQKVIDRIKDVIVAPQKTPNDIPLVTPLPQKEVRDFGGMQFESQAKLVFHTFPAHEAEIIGKTDNSGAGTVSVPPVSGS